MSRPTAISLGALIGALGLTLIRLLLDWILGHIPPDDGWIELYFLILAIVSVPQGAVLGGITAAGRELLREGKVRVAGLTWSIGGTASVVAWICLVLGCDGLNADVWTFLWICGLPSLWGLGLIVAGLLRLSGMGGSES